MEKCCQDLSNRLPPVQVAKDIVVSQCGVCGRKHYELAVDPGIVGYKGSAL